MTAQQLAAKTQILNSLNLALSKTKAFIPVSVGAFVVTLGGRLDQFACIKDNYAAVDNGIMPTQYGLYDANYLCRSSFSTPSGKKIAVNKMTATEWKAARIAELTQLINETEKA